MARLNAKEYRKGLDAELEARLAFLQKTFGDLTEEQLNWKPAEDQWSVGQCLDHLIKTDSKYLAAMGPAVEAVKSKGSTEGDSYRHAWMARMIINAMRPESKILVPVPKMLEPTAEPVGREIVHRLADEIAKIKDLLRRSEGVDLGRAVFASPFQKFVKVRVSDAFKILETHDHRHLLQAERVMKMAGFPSPVSLSR